LRNYVGVSPNLAETVGYARPPKLTLQIYELN
jgi:hypothetical protein